MSEYATASSAPRKEKSETKASKKKLKKKKIKTMVTTSFSILEGTGGRMVSGVARRRNPGSHTSRLETLCWRHEVGCGRKRWEEVQVD